MRALDRKGGTAVWHLTSLWLNSICWRISHYLCPQNIYALLSTEWLQPSLCGTHSGDCHPSCLELENDKDSQTLLKKKEVRMHWRVQGNVITWYSSMGDYETVFWKTDHTNLFNTRYVSIEWVSLSALSMQYVGSSVQSRQVYEAVTYQDYSFTSNLVEHFISMVSIVKAWK